MLQCFLTCTGSSFYCNILYILFFQSFNYSSYTVHFICIDLFCVWSDLFTCCYIYVMTDIVMQTRLYYYIYVYSKVNFFWIYLAFSLHSDKSCAILSYKGVRQRFWYMSLVDCLSMGTVLFLTELQVSVSMETLLDIILLNQVEIQITLDFDLFIGLT